MGFPTIQVSLGGGELSPEVRARIDVEKIGTGASLLKNMFVRTSGGVSNRTGLEYTVHCINDAYAAALIPFQFNVEQTYAMVLQSRVLRIIKDGSILTYGAQPISAITNANPAVVTNAGHVVDHNAEVFLYHQTGPALPTNMDELENRFFRASLILDATKNITAATQASPVSISVAAHGYATGSRVYISNVAGMTQLNGRTFTITSTGVGTFTLDGVDGTGYTTYVSGGWSQRADANTFQLVGEDTSAIGVYAGTARMAYKEVIEVVIPYDADEVLDVDYTQSNDVLTLVHPSHPPANLNRYSETDWRYEVIGAGAVLAFPTTVLATYVGSGTGRAYAYRVTAYNENTGEESIASASSTIASGNLSATGDKCVITYGAVSGATIYNIYKAEDGSEFYGFIGSSNALTFTDRNIIPEYSDSPALSTRNPFSSTGNYPAKVEYHQARRWFANTNNDPVKLWGSVSGNFANFNVSKAVKADDAVTATISAKQANAIQAMIPIGDMLIFTTGSEWLLKSAGTGKLITPETASFEVQGYWGSMPLKPIVIGATALFVTGNIENNTNNAKFSMVRDIQYTFQTDKYQGNELSVLATHLFLNKDVVDWFYAQVPHSLVWCVLNDGTALAMTYVSEHEIFAWSRHETDGEIERVCAVREGGEDAVYFIVRRNINGTWKRMVERLHSNQFDEVQDWFGVDAGVTFDEKVIITGITNANPAVVTFGQNIDDYWIDGDKIDLSEIEGMTELNGNRYTVTNKTPSTCQLTDSDGNIVNSTSFGIYFQNGIARTVISTMKNLRHLEGEQVVGLVDGNVLGLRTVVDGQVALDDEYSRVHVGKPYTSEFQTIDANIPIKSGVIVGTVRKIDGVTFRFYKTVGGQVGSSPDKVYDLKWRNQELWGEAGRLSNGDVWAQVHSRYERAAKVYYKQPNPLPVTILSVVPEVSKGDD